MVVPLGLKDHMDLVAPLDLAAPVGLEVPVDLAAQLRLKDPLVLAAPLDLVDLVAPEDLAAPLDLVAQADIQDPVVTPVLGAPEAPEATLALEDQVDLVAIPALVGRVPAALAATLREEVGDTDLQEALAREPLDLMENPALVHILDLELQALIQSQDQVGDIQVQDRDLIQALLGRVHIRREVTEADLGLAPEAAIRDHRGQALAQVVVMVAVLLDHFLSHLHHLTRDLQAALADILAVVLVLELQAVRDLVLVPTP
ncbi:hypothetical protein ISCGN_001560 [Ixodes scapularis]